jgi:hypothetical protein
MTGFGCNLTNGIFTTCTVKDTLTVGENGAGTIEM